MPKDAAAQTPGYVYVLVNSALPGLVKIGLTRGTSKARAEELSRGTAVPSAFIVIYDEPVADCVDVERRLHEKFAPLRESSRREFFRVSPKEAIVALQRIARFSPFIDDSDVTRIDVLPRLAQRAR